jgi:hypothetical protein
MSLPGTKREFGQEHFYVRTPPDNRPPDLSVDEPKPPEAIE